MDSGIFLVKMRTKVSLLFGEFGCPDWANRGPGLALLNTRMPLKSTGAKKSSEIPAS
jgi:hypothetical protein